MTFSTTRYLQARKEELKMLFQGAGKFSREQVRVGSPGGIFNIEFSGDGKVGWWHNQRSKSISKLKLQWEGAGGRLREKEHSPL